MEEQRDTRRRTTWRLEADTEWDEWTCVLGFPVMGIWPDGSDGTDVNSVHASNDKQHLVVGDDHGHVRLLNNPCVVEDAPSKDYGGHSSHVMNVKYLHDDTHVVSVVEEAGERHAGRHGGQEPRRGVPARHGRLPVVGRFSRNADAQM